MTVKLFGYEGVDCVSRLYVSLPRKIDDLMLNLIREGRIMCAACRTVLTRNMDRFTFSQVTFGTRKLTYQVICGTCVVPVQKAIQEVMSGAGKKEQARPAEEAAPAIAGAGSGS